jgi:hypothetical protein
MIVKMSWGPPNQIVRQHPKHEKGKGWWARQYTSGIGRCCARNHFRLREATFEQAIERVCLYESVRRAEQLTLAGGRDIA